jgi:tRNA uridine 5-carbamoylmethylation protein Kti12
MELNRDYEDLQLKRFQEFLILVVKEDKELEDLIIKFEEENLKNAWTYVLEKIKELAKATTYIDDGTKVLEFAKEYFMDYKQIKAKKEEARLDQERIKAQEARLDQERIKAQEARLDQERIKAQEEERNLFSF